MGIEIAPAPTSSAPLRASKLGEELPLFCEKCGYSLHGLPQVRCEQCGVLQFHCPECNHHQPINTLRPVFQRALGRMRAAWLVVWVLFKLNFFGWLLFAWGALAAEGLIRYDYEQMRSGNMRVLTSQPFIMEVAFATMMFAIPFGLIGRLLLLRWRSSLLTGLGIAGLTLLAMFIGVFVRVADAGAFGTDITRDLQIRFWNSELAASFTWICTMEIAGAMLAWPVWVMLVRAFLSPKVSTSLLEWQRSLSDRSASTMARE